jgi:hypothetical protein
MTIIIYPNHSHCEYRLPNGNLFKRKYIGYTKLGATREFNRALKSCL